jgi:hypothetical protein
MRCTRSLVPLLVLQRLVALGMQAHLHTRCIGIDVRHHTVQAVRHNGGRLIVTEQLVANDSWR